MLARNQEPQYDTMSPAGGPAMKPLFTVTGEKASIEGRFRIADSLHIECEIGGELEVGGRLVIGERGVARADVHTVDALIMGTYEGNMVATGNVTIAATGRVIGNLTTDSLVIEKGGFFNGNVAGIEKPAQMSNRISSESTLGTTGQGVAAGLAEPEKVPASSGFYASNGDSNEPPIDE